MNKALTLKQLTIVTLFTLLLFPPVGLVLTIVVLVKFVKQLNKPKAA